VSVKKGVYSCSFSRVECVFNGRIYRTEFFPSQGPRTRSDPQCRSRRYCKAGDDENLCRIVTQYKLRVRNSPISFTPTFDKRHNFAKKKFPKFSPEGSTPQHLHHEGPSDSSLLPCSDESQSNMRQTCRFRGAVLFCSPTCV